MPPTLKNLTHYALYSGGGLVLDVGVFGGLTHAALPVAPFWANMAGGATAASFVYFATARRIFAYRGRFLWPKWLAYVGYIALQLVAASTLVAWLAVATLYPPLLCKLASSPCSFC
jgi:hypothetical protein